MAGFILYGTEGCHLCEDAEQILADAGIDFQSNDIIENQEWQEKYGLLIPVLLHVENQRQLNWPFDKAAIANFCREG